MKKEDIKVGGRYLARISGNIVVVRVLDIREFEGFRTPTSTGASRRVRAETRYDVINERTNRKTTFSSAAKFRGVAKEIKSKTLVETLSTPEEIAPARAAALVADDRTNRTPDAELDRSEVEDQPTEKLTEAEMATLLRNAVAEHDLDWIVYQLTEGAVAKRNAADEGANPAERKYWQAAVELLTEFSERSENLSNS